MTGVVLDYLSEQLNCYISSLPTPAVLPRAISLLAELEGGRFSVGEYDYALAYLLGESYTFENAEQVAGFIDRKREEFKDQIEAE